LEDLKTKFDVVISDYVKLEKFNCIPLVKGDERSLSCACASVVAKVLRDRIMEHYHTRFPGFNFHKNKGYPTPDHLRALRELKPTPIHRKSFLPLRQLELYAYSRSA
jgi:ribonuclease HII